MALSIYDQTCDAASREVRSPALFVSSLLIPRARGRITGNIRNHRGLELQNEPAGTAAAGERALAAAAVANATLLARANLVVIPGPLSAIDAIWVWVVRHAPVAAREVRAGSIELHIDSCRRRSQSRFAIFLHPPSVITRRQ